MKLLITGNNGFLGKDLFDFFKKDGKYEIIGISRKDGDLLNSNFVNNLPNANILIHCASNICRKNKKQNPEILYNNIIINENILNNAYKYEKIFIFGSGAEFDQGSNVVSSCNTKKYNNKIPKDYYGLSKYITRLRASQYKNIYWLRGFIIFGENELDDRFVKKCFEKLIKNEDFYVNDRKISIFSTYDIKNIIEQIIIKGCEFNEVDLSYNQTTLLDIALLIKDITNSSSNIILTDENKNYYSNWSAENYFSLFGLRKSLNKLYSYIQSL